MRDTRGFWRSAIVGLAVVIAGPSLAQTPDLFQSAPGPETPKTKPRPRATQPGPEAEPVPIAPRPSAVPQPSTVSIPDVSGGSANQSKRFDGIWVGRFECNATKEKPARSFPYVFEVKNNQVSKLNSGSEVPGTPGYDHYEGTITPDGRVFLRRNAVGAGLVPGALARGEAVTLSYDGFFSGDNFVATERPSQICRISLTRHR